MIYFEEWFTWDFNGGCIMTGVNLGLKDFMNMVGNSTSIGYVDLKGHQLVKTSNHKFLTFLNDPNHINTTNDNNRIIRQQFYNVLKDSLKLDASGSLSSNQQIFLDKAKNVLLGEDNNGVPLLNKPLERRVVRSMLMDLEVANGTFAKVIKNPTTKDLVILTNKLMETNNAAVANKDFQQMSYVRNMATSFLMAMYGDKGLPEATISSLSGTDMLKCLKEVAQHRVSFTISDGIRQFAEKLFKESSRHSAVNSQQIEEYMESFKKASEEDKKLISFSSHADVKGSIPVDNRKLKGTVSPENFNKIDNKIQIANEDVKEIDDKLKNLNLSENKVSDNKQLIDDSHKTENDNVAQKADNKATEKTGNNSGKSAPIPSNGFIGSLVDGLGVGFSFLTNAFSFIKKAGNVDKIEELKQKTFDEQVKDVKQMLADLCYDSTSVLGGSKTKPGEN